MARRRCTIIKWVLVGFVLMTLLFLYSFNSVYKETILDKNLLKQINVNNDVGKRGNKPIIERNIKSVSTIRKNVNYDNLSVQKPGIFMKEVNDKDIYVEGDEIHLHVKRGKIIVHNSTEEIIDEDLINVNYRKKKNYKIRPTTKKPTVRTTTTKRTRHIPRKEIKVSGFSKNKSSIVIKRSSRPELVQIPRQYSGSKTKKLLPDSHNRFNMVRVSSTPSSQHEIDTFIQNYTKECESNPLNISYTYRSSTDRLCPCLPGGLGKLEIKNRIPVPPGKTSVNYDVKSSGIWRPTSCIARQRIAIIVPYRNRKKHLDMFLHHMHGFLQKQDLEYSIIIVEQQSPKVFNRAALMNIGFVEANKLGMFHCFIFHDVDLLPEDTRNIYTCTTSPRHVAVAVDKFRYRLQYWSIVGGALAMTRDQMLTINGFSNKFYGWGGEDDDMFNRISAKEFKVARYPEVIARYTMLEHFIDDGNPPNPTGGVGLQMRREVYDVDGLNSLKYKTVKTEQTKNCIFVKVNIL